MGSPIDRAGRAVAGLIGYNPGPGIYSRLERAVEGMPANVRVEEIPGLLKRYKDGVPGWELKAADLDSVVAGRSVVPREELLSAVRERSPVYTHREVVLGGNQPGVVVNAELGSKLPTYQDEAARLGAGVSHGEPHYESYGQGGKDYAELLLLQPDAYGYRFGSHWDGGSGQSQAVAHARYDTHGDALRINELQSDLGIYNRRQRETSRMPPAPLQNVGETDGAYAERLEGLGYEVEWSGGGYEPVNAPLAFPLEDAWSDLLIKRLALEAARQGHRAIEIASPRAIADKVGGNIENYEHFYGKVVPGAIERLGRKMGGVVDDTGRERPNTLSPYFKEAMYGYSHLDELTRDLPYGAITGPYGNLLASFQVPETQKWAMSGMFERLAAHVGPEEAGRRLNELFLHAQRHHAADMAVRLEAKTTPGGSTDVPRRYIMSDEMRKRILTQGIGASLLAPMAMEE